MASNGYDEAYAAARVKSLDDAIAAAQATIEAATAERERYTTSSPFKGNKKPARSRKADEG